MSEKWIPVSEQLPPVYPGCIYVSDTVLLYCIGDEGEPFYVAGYFDHNYKEWRVSTSGNLLDYCVVEMWRVIEGPKDHP